MAIDRPDQVVADLSIMGFVQVRFVQKASVDENFSVADLNGFAGQADYSFYVAFVRIVRKPENNDVAAFQVAPADAFEFVINELVDEKPFAVVKLRHHRRAFDDDGLNCKNAEQNENNDYQKNIAREPEAFEPNALPRFAPKMNDVDVRIVVRGYRPEFYLVFPAKIEHNRNIRIRCGKAYARFASHAFIIEIIVLTARLSKQNLMDTKIRSLFPAADEYTYLNSAAVSPPPTTAVEAVSVQLNDAAKRGSLGFPEWVATKGRVRALVAEMLGAEVEQVAFMRNTSDGFASVANGLPWKRGDNIVSFAGEFPANFYPWRMVRDRFGVELRLCPERNGRIDMDEFVSLIDANTRLVSISAVQFASGFTADLERIGRAARAVDALFAVDIIQGLGARGFDLPAEFVDIASGASHKWLCAPEGCGILYLSDRARERIEPTHVGWISVETPWDFEDRTQPFKPNALAWESGTGPAALFYGLEQSLLLIKSIGTDLIRKYLDELSEYLCAGLAEKNYDLISSREPAERSPIVCVKHRAGLHCNEIAETLEREKVIVSPRGDRLRISPHFYNNREDIDTLIAALP